MSTPDKKSHWASLANVLGAKVPPEPKQQVPVKSPEPEPTPVAPVVEETAPVAETPAPIAPTSAPPASKANPKSKVRDNWGKVLGALGLRAPEPEPEPEPEIEAPAPAPVQAILPPANPLPKNLWELLGDKAPEPTAERSENELFSGEVGGNDLMLGEDADEEEEPVRNGRTPPRAAEPVKSIGEFDRPRRRDEEESGDRPRRRRRRRRRRGEAGVESAETAAPIDDYDDSVPTSRQHADDDEPLDEEFAPPVESYDSEEELDAPPARSASEDGERPRRRRRRRRGRGRGADTQATAPEVETVRDSGYDDVEEGDEEEFSPPPPRRDGGRSAAPPRGRRVEAAPVRDSHDAEDEDDDDVVDHGEHRSIPTWQDAIGLVVGANMEARAKNPHANRGGRGRGGRGRGGRGR